MRPRRERVTQKRQWSQFCRCKPQPRLGNRHSKTRKYCNHGATAAAITKNGFTTKQSNIVVTGTLLSDNGKVTLRVSGSNETFALVPQNQQAQDFSHLNGKTVTVEGVIPEEKKGTKPDTIAVHSITGA